MRKRLLCALTALCLLAPAACRRTPEPVKYTTFAMDTVMSFTLYGDTSQAASTQADQMAQMLSQMDRELSVTGEDSDISRVNRGDGRPVELGGRACELLRGALSLCEVTGGALDITAYPAVRAWGFTGEEYQVPSPAELEELVQKIDYTAVKQDGNTVTLPAGMELDLGAVAKGFAGDLLAADARENGISSALLNLGQSTIVAIGSKPGDKPWRVAVQDPDGEGSIGVVELTDCAMGTSGGYQRFFEEDGVTYWHILDPDTAAPARSGLTSVTVVSPSALTCDGLSTALFVMGLEEGAQFWRDHPELEFEALFVTEEGGVCCTAGLADRFVPDGREVTVLK